MALYGSDDIGFLLVGGFDLRPNATDFTHNSEALLEETTVLGSSWQEQSFTGVRRHDLSVSGFYDDAEGRSVAALTTRAGTERVLSYALEGNTIGKNFVGFAGGVEAKVSRVAERGALHKLNTEIQGSGILEEGKILFALGSTGSATGNTQSSPVNNGASATGGAGYLHVSAFTLDTATGFHAWVRHSSDDVTYADLITFTPTSSTAGLPMGERIATTGMVEQYLAAAWRFGTTADPGGASRSATFFVGFART